MTRTGALGALAASVALLAGCAPAPQLPPHITAAEAQQRVDDRNRMWWEGMFPDEPMPVIDTIEMRDPISPDDLVYECFKGADIEGVTYTDDGSWTYRSDDASLDAAVNRALITCSLEYPVDISDPVALGWLSEAESEWVWNYTQQRLVPCLRLLGYTVAGRASEYEKGSDQFWSPYYDMHPLPDSPAQWRLIDSRCPPSPIGPVYRPVDGG